MLIDLKKLADEISEKTGGKGRTIDPIMIMTLIAIAERLECIANSLEQIDDHQRFIHDTKP